MFSVLQLEPTVSVLALHGDLNQNSIDPHQAGFDEVSVNRKVNVILDLTHVSSMDGYALKFFLRLARGLHTHKARLLVAAPQPSVEHTLRSANYHTLIPILPSVSESIDYALSA